MIQVIKEKFREYNLEIDDTQAEQFAKFYDMLIEKNKVMNLTAITEFDEVLLKHFIDSVSIENILKKYNLLDSVSHEKDYNILDLGTGAGFPGIPLKIYYPNINITLLDSLNKRVGFLNEVIDALKLSNAKAIHGRAEDFARDKDHREKYDLVVSRAVANASTLSEYCLPYVKVGGYFIAYKSKDSDDEIKESKNAIKKLGGNLEEVYKFDIEDNGRSFMIIKKEVPTPNLYPRKAGTPSKKPL